MIIGNITVNNIKHFNLFQKIMYKIFFGIKIVDIKQAKGGCDEQRNKI